MTLALGSLNIFVQMAMALMLGIGPKYWPARASSPRLLSRNQSLQARLCAEFGDQAPTYPFVCPRSSSETEKHRAGTETSGGAHRSSLAAAQVPLRPILSSPLLWRRSASPAPSFPLLTGPGRDALRHPQLRSTEPVVAALPPMGTAASPPAPDGCCSCYPWPAPPTPSPRPHHTHTQKP